MLSVFFFARKFRSDSGSGAGGGCRAPSRCAEDAVTSVHDGRGRGRPGGRVRFILAPTGKPTGEPNYK